MTGKICLNMANQFRGNYCDQAWIQNKFTTIISSNLTGSRLLKNCTFLCLIMIFIAGGSTGTGAACPVLLPLILNHRSPPTENRGACIKVDLIAGQQVIKNPVTSIITGPCKVFFGIKVEARKQLSNHLEEDLQMLIDFKSENLEEISREI